MSNEVKAVSFRLSETDIQRFREFAEEQGMNQAEMFQALVNNFEMSKAKGIITDRAKEIEVFQDTVNNLIGMFINSLTINQTSEERIREVLSLELHTKDQTIADLQERLKENKNQITLYKEETTSLSKQLTDLISVHNSLNKELEEKAKTIDSLQSQAKTLNTVLDEYKIYRDMYKKLEEANKELSNQVDALAHKNTDLEAKIVNTENMTEFYKSELSSLKVEMKEQAKEHKKEIKALEASNVKSIDGLNQKHSKEIEALKNKIDAERMQLQEELNKALAAEKEAKSEIETLKTKSTKTIKGKK